MVDAVDPGGLAYIASDGALHAGLELRSVNSQREHGHHAEAVLRHVASHRPLELGFANVHGSAALEAGKLRVSISAPPPLGLSLMESHGRVIVGHVTEGGAAHSASGGRIEKGMRLVSVRGETVHDLQGTMEMLGNPERPLQVVVDEADSMSQFRVKRPNPALSERMEALKAKEGAEGKGGATAADIRVLDLESGE